MPFYIKHLDNGKYFLLLCHILLGIVIIEGQNRQIYFLSTLWAWSIFFYGIYSILKNRNRYNEAALFSAYSVGIEIALRMTAASIFWEFSKYSVIIFCLLGLYMENIRGHKISILMLIYILSFFPSIIFIPYISFNEWRQVVAFNLSGPLTLFISVLYFRNRLFYKKELLQVFRALLFPITTMSIIIFLRLPSLDKILFSSEANQALSGYYGPNQVSSMLGIIVAVIGLTKLLNYRIFKNELIDYLLLGICALQAFLTFARGGMITAIISIGFAWFVSSQKKSKNTLIKKSKIIFLTIIIIIIWNFSADFTGGMIQDRYIAVISSDEPGQIAGTSRTLIMLADLNIFLDNFITGVGPGMANDLRKVYGYGKSVAAHSEITRLLAEHGLLGVMALIVSIVFILKEYFFRDENNKTIFMCFILIAVLTMFHSAMRLAMPGFIFGLAFMILVDSQLKIQEK